MARAFAEQMERADYQALSFDDRLGLMVDREAQDRDNRRLDRYLRTAKLRIGACVEDINFQRSRGLDRSVVLSLAEAEWVRGHRNVLIVGATGVGKTFVACALAHAAIRRGHNALYLRAPRLLSELALARADGRLPRLMTRWAKVDVLVVDDVALRPLTPEQAADLLEIIEDRYQLRSTIVTSQLPVSEWHDALGEPTIADAILDRLVHNAHRIELRGDSLRRTDDVSERSETPDEAGDDAKPAEQRARGRKRAAESV
jgi:DNA replication protein DnaC